MKGGIKTDDKGKIAWFARWQTWVIIGLAAAVVYLVVVEGRPFDNRGEAGIDLEVVYANGETIRIVPDRTYSFSILDPQTIVDSGGNEVTSVRSRLWVYPTLTDIDASSVLINYSRNMICNPPTPGISDFHSTESISVTPDTKTVLDGSALSFNHTQFLYGDEGTYTIAFTYTGTGEAGGYSDDFSPSASITVTYTKTTPQTGSIVISAGVQTDKLQIIGR